MNRRPLFFGFLGVLLTAILSTSVFAADGGESTEKDAKKNITTLVLTAKPAAIHSAALQALAGIGCIVLKDTPDAIEAKRPHKLGLAVGSGGEKLFVTVTDLGQGKSELKVTTKKTLVGIVGQKLWNEEVAGQIRDAVK